MNQPSASQRVIRFGTFEADLAAREIRKNGVKLRLQEQPFQVLSVLLENPDQVVTREELRQGLWPEDTFVDFDNGLNTAINKIREALGDSSESPRFIETIPRRGYRFIAPVQGLPAKETHLLPAPLPSVRKKIGWLAAAAVVLVFVTVGGYFFALSHQAPSTAAEPVRLQIPVPEKTSLTGPFAVSPDGRQLAFEATGSDGVIRLWVRPLNSLEARPVPGSESPVNDLFFWSPDSRFIAFGADGKLKKIDVTSGSAQTLCDASFGIQGGSWNPDGVIIFGNAESGTLMQVSANGGAASPLTTLDSSRGETAHSFPSFLPDGRHFIYLRSSPNPANRGIYVGSLDAKPAEQNSRQLLTTGFQAVYTSSPDPDSGKLLFLRDGTLLAQQFDARRLKLTGEPVTVAEQVGFYSIYGWFSASTAGVLIYRTGNASGWFQLTWYDRQGKAVGKLGQPSTPHYVALSPDGTQGAVQLMDSVHPASIILLFDLLQGTTTRFMSGSSSSGCPVWSPDGSRIIFWSDRAGESALYEKAVSGEKDEEFLLKSDKTICPTSWSRDGRFMLYHTVEKNSDLWVLPLEGDKKPIPFLRTEFDEWNGRFSPDGRWVAYVSNESGRYEVYVRAFSPDSTGTASGAGPKWLISTDGGGEVRWRADGKELYYIAPDGKLMAVAVTTGQVFQGGTPKPLFSIPVPNTPGQETAFMDAADGKRFLLRVHTNPAQPPFTVVQNWQVGLKK